MDMATTETEALTPICPAAEAEAARIAEDRAALATEEENERELIALRKTKLADASDAEIDEIELKIGSSRSKQLRIIERIDVRTQRLVAANEAHKSAELDALASKADRARQLGEDLISEYGKAAKALAPMLRRLCAIETVIEQANQQLNNAGRPTIASPNVIRGRPSKEFDHTVRKRVGIAERGHPFFGKDYSQSQNPACEFVTLRENGQQVPRFMDVDVVEHVYQRFEWPSPIHETTYLPGIEVPEAESASIPIYDGEHAAVDETVLRQLEAELDGSTLQKLSKAASKFLGAKK